MEDKLVEYARSIGMNEQSFKSAIERIYASIQDMELDKNPGVLIVQKTLFSGHRIIIESRREPLN